MGFAKAPHLMNRISYQDKSIRGPILILRFLNTGHIRERPLLPYVLKCNAVGHMDVKECLDSLFSIRSCVSRNIFPVIPLIQFRKQKPEDLSAPPNEGQRRVVFGI